MKKEEVCKRKSRFFILQNYNIAAVCIQFGIVKLNIVDYQL